MPHVPSLSPASWKAVSMDKAYLFKDGPNKFASPPGKIVNRHFTIQVQKFCCLLLVLFPSFHSKCSALGFRTFGCPSLWLTMKEKIAMKLGNTRLFCCTPQMFRQTKPRWRGVNWQQRLQGNSTAHCLIPQKQICSVFIMHYYIWIQQSWILGVSLTTSKNPLLGVQTLLLSHAWFIVGVSALDSGIWSTKAILYIIMETARV